MDSSSNTSGASRAADFQPPTNNPQSNAVSNLQPVAPTSGSNLFNQPSINPQALPQSDSLKVISNGSTVSTTAGQENNTAGPASWATPTAFLITTVFLLAVILLIARTARPADKLVDTPVQPPPKPAKPKTKKKNRTKKKKR